MGVPLASPMAVIVTLLALAGTAQMISPTVVYGPAHVAGGTASAGRAPCASPSASGTASRNEQTLSRRARRTTDHLLTRGAGAAAGRSETARGAAMLVTITKLL